MVYMRSYQKLPQCPIELMPAGSRIDLQLAKVKPIRNGGNTSGITDFKRGKKDLQKCW